MQQYPGGDDAQSNQGPDPYEPTQISQPGQAFPPVGSEQPTEYVQPDPYAQQPYGAQPAAQYAQQPYAQQQPYGAQPPYGAPAWNQPRYQSPYPPQYAQGGSGGSGGNGMVIAAVVGLLVVVGLVLTVVLVTKDDDDKPVRAVPSVTVPSELSTPEISIPTYTTPTYTTPTTTDYRGSGWLGTFAGNVPATSVNAGDLHTYSFTSDDPVEGRLTIAGTNGGFCTMAITQNSRSSATRVRLHLATLDDPGCTTIDVWATVSATTLTIEYQVPMTISRQ